jgi:hypothetical protein
LLSLVEQHIIRPRWLNMNRRSKTRKMTALKRKYVEMDLETLAFVRASTFDAPPRNPLGERLKAEVRKRLKAKIDFDSLRAEIRQRNAKTLARLAE